ILSRWGNFYCRLITGMPFRDCTGGFNLINIELIKKIDFSKFDASGYAFIMELKYNLYKLGASFKEVPIIFKNRREGESKISKHIISEGVVAPWKMRFKK
ncbi:MAG: polyprenol monophosphomannose synthase, partial [bacterium]|nr:polyprenol monophosphomannose synthase [bacterium]